MDELTMALGNPEHPERCRGYGVVPWKYAFKGNLNSYKSRKRIKEREEEHWMTTNNTQWIFSVGAPHVSSTSHSAASQCRWRTEVRLRIFLDRLATTR
jgi:hypothetical protein